MRLLILFGLVYLGYRVLKSWMLQNRPTGNSVSHRAAGVIDDVMVKDPFCEVFFPKKDGVHLRLKGKDFYFCSTACRDRFLEAENKT